MAATAVTLNDVEGHSPVVGFSNAIRRTFVQHFTRFQLTMCSHGSSALAELLVPTFIGRGEVHACSLKCMMGMSCDRLSVICHEVESNKSFRRRNAKHCTQ